MAGTGWVAAFRLFIGASLSWVLHAGSHAAPLLQVAAASDLAPSIAEINRAFQQSTNAEVRTSLGASGNLHAQIRNGAPFDVYLSADTLYPTALADAGLADRSSLTIYAIGRLAMVAGDAAVPLDAGMAALHAPTVKRIAIANPDVAPYGRAARAALQNAKAWEGVRQRLIIGENVAQAAQFVDTGNADLGFIGASHVKPGQRSWMVPQTLYPPIEQGGIITNKGRDNPLAARYLAFLRSEDGQAVLRRHGFSLPARTQ